MAAFHGEPILGPETLNVDQGTLPLAEQEVLQGGNGEEVVLGEAVPLALGCHAPRAIWWRPLWVNRRLSENRQPPGDG